MRQRAVTQAFDPAGEGVAALDEIIGPIAKGLGADAEKVRKQLIAEIRQQAKVIAFEATRKDLTPGMSGLALGFGGGIGGAQTDFNIPSGFSTGAFGTHARGPVNEIAALREAMRELIDVLRSRGSDTLAPINVYNSTFNGADGAAFERRVRASSAVGAARSLEPAGARR